MTRWERAGVLVVLAIVAVCMVLLTVHMAARRDEKPTKQDKDNCLVDRAVARSQHRALPDC